MSAKWRVLVTTRFFDDAAVAWLEAHRCAVERAGLRYDQSDGHLDEAALAPFLADTDAWIVGAARVSRSVLALSQRLKVIARRGVGYDLVDVAAAGELGKIVTISPGGNEPAVADHAIAMMLSVGARVPQSQARMAEGDWRALPGLELTGKIVGLVGFGRIGRLVAQRLGGFGVRILAYDPFLDAEAGHHLGVEAVSLDALLTQADIISLHVPVSAETRNLIGAPQLQIMKPTAILVNTARGGLVDEQALLQALDNGRIWGAGLDVFAGETGDDPQTLALVRHPRVVATPHIAGSSREALARTNLISARCVLDLLEGRSPSVGQVVV
ncbi:hydroxyacid dehydrogenase [Devosia epidermidihirudinis]|uniref:Hydroxyacid dehydrogenase n=1 Tax=Devosia epidermidihirudinis TaxID=1293439 RepID=A0A0F5Q9G4_9HYPH|nr:phosphoglycerate dehydrogenase [Devosia epidermidihirudinis]KKC37408.1 hydroxyacid dehydrogenase [Devosia epidermidihirudinis]